MLIQYEKKPTKKYNCNMVELYSGLETLWKSQGQHEAEFANENTLYTPGLWLTRKAAIEAAQAMPDGQARGEQAEMLHNRLKEKRNLAMTKWNSLDGFIQKAFKGSDYKTHIEAAGKKHQTKAMKNNWKETEALLQSANSFIAKYSLVLTNDGGMPAGFAGQFNTVMIEFKQLFQDFLAARIHARELTAAKILANNAIWEDGVSMMKDGKRIFRMNAAVRRRFTWSKIMELMGEYGKEKESGAVPGEA